MLKIYGVYRSRASWNIWMCLELGIPFEHIPIIPAYRIDDLDAPDAPPHSMTKEFLKLNPNGKVPVVVDGELVLDQSLAVNEYLARKYGGPLSAANLAEEAKMLTWTHWVATEVEPSAVDILHHRLTYPAHKKQPEIADEAIVRLRSPFSVLENHLKTRAWVLGDRFTVADLNIAVVLSCAASAPELFASAPCIVEWMARCQSRPAYLELARQREAQPGLDEIGHQLQANLGSDDGRDHRKRTKSQA